MTRPFLPLFAPVVFTLLGCSSQTSPSVPDQPLEPAKEEPGTVATISSQNQVEGRTSEEPTHEAPTPPSAQVLPFTRVLEENIRSIALGKPPRIAVLADQPWLHDIDGWQPKPLPPQYAIPPQGRIDIYFGRDNRPRLMGTTLLSQEGSGSEAYYLRLKAAGWQREPSEIGRLGGRPAGGLFGILGHDDPEVVCKVSDVCLVKRRSGWTTLPSGPGMPQVFLQDGEVWALHPDRVATLGEKGWQDLPGTVPWSNATGLWGFSSEALWVSVAEENALYFYQARSWTKFVSPVREPRGLWGSSPKNLWVVGKDGAGFFDGSQWQRAKGPEGPLVVVTGSDAKNVWLGGESGLWHGRFQRSSKNESNRQSWRLRARTFEAHTKLTRERRACSSHDDT